MGAAPLSWLAKIGGDTLKTKAKLLSSAINELYDDGFKKGNIVGLDYIKAATADDLKNKVPEANAVKELNSSLEWKRLNSANGDIGYNGVDISSIYSLCKEIHVIVQYLDTSNSFCYQALLDLKIPQDISNPDRKYVYHPFGGYSSNNYYWDCEINASTKKISCQALRICSSANLAGDENCRIWVYYR